MTRRPALALAGAVLALVVLATRRRPGAARADCRPPQLDELQARNSVFADGFALRAAQEATPTPEVVRLPGPANLVGVPGPAPTAVSAPPPTPTTVPARTEPHPAPSPAVAGHGSDGVRITLAFLAEIGVLGVALAGAGAYVRARELDVEERALALRTRGASGLRRLAGAGPVPRCSRRRYSPRRCSS